MDNTKIDCFVDGREKSIQFENKKGWTVGGLGVPMLCCEASAGEFFVGLILFERLHKHSMKYGVLNCSRQKQRRCGF